MKKGIIQGTICAVILLAATACLQAKKVIGNKNYITREIKTEQFEHIKLSGSPDVIYKQISGSPKVQIYAPDNVIDLIEIKVINNTLMIKFRDNISLVNCDKLEIRVSSPSLESASIQGSGDIVLANGIKNTNKDFKLSISGSGDIEGKQIYCANLDLSINGSGDIELDHIVANHVESKITGSGDITLEGKAKTANYGISGSGDIEATKLMINTVHAKISGSGDITCFATQSLSGGVSGSGTVSYRGNPKNIEFSRKGLRKL